MDNDPETSNLTWSDHPSVRIIEAVAAATGRTTTDLPRLQETVDADALDALLTGGSSVAVSFWYADTCVSVDGDGTIGVQVDGRDSE